MNIVSAIRWNIPVFGVPHDHMSGYKGHPKVRFTTYDEVFEILKTPGNSKNNPLWTWQVLGILETVRGKLIVYPGDWIVELFPDHFIALTDFEMGNFMLQGKLDVIHKMIELAKSGIITYVVRGPLFSLFNNGEILICKDLIFGLSVWTGTEFVPITEASIEEYENATRLIGNNSMEFPWWTEWNAVREKLKVPS